MTACERIALDDLQEILRNAMTPEAVIEASARTPFLLTDEIENGQVPRTINRMTAEVNDAILRKFIAFAVEALGPPPSAFSFLVFGSVGRQEQTLKTDQDNAIIYEDIEPERTTPVRDYFLALGKMVCTWMDRAGYAFCEGGNMAMNSNWCQPISVWKQVFTQWVGSATDKDLLRVNIVFDFRCAWGDAWVEQELRDHLEQLVADNDRFFQILARNILEMATPVGIFGRFVVETEGPKRGSFNIKNAMMPIVDFARIYAMKHAVPSTNTIDRLTALRERNVLSDMSLDLEAAYASLMQTRLRLQARAVISRTVTPSNHVYPNSLSSNEQKQLKECFAQIKAFKAKLSYDFTGRSAV